MLTLTFCFQTSRYGILRCLHWILIGNRKCVIDRKLKFVLMRSAFCRGVVSVQFGSKELHRSFFGSRPIFRAGKIPKTPFLGLSLLPPALLPNPTEMLATQATMNEKFQYRTRRPRAVLKISRSLLVNECR